MHDNRYDGFNNDQNNHSPFTFKTKYFDKINGNKNCFELHNI